MRAKLYPLQLWGNNDTPAVLEESQAARIGNSLGIYQKFVFAKLFNLECIRFPVQLGNVGPRLVFCNLHHFATKLLVPLYRATPDRLALLVCPAERRVHFMKLLSRFGIGANLRLRP